MRSQSSFGGIYLPVDVSHILNLPKSTVRHWMREYWDNRIAAKKGITYSFGDKGNKAIDFLTLMEFFTFYQLRKKGVSVKKIIDAHEEIGRVYHTRFPFALSKKIYSEQKKVWYEYLNEMICADGKHQLALKKIIDPFLAKIEFDDSNLATRFSPLGNGRYVVVDPKVQFGEPVVSGTRITASTIIRLLRGGESKEHVALLYRLPIAAINDVEEFYDKQAA
jgi:uncharacterized protein (DUF433 family)